MSDPTPEAYEAAEQVLSERIYREPGKLAPLQANDARAVARAVWPIAQQAKAAEMLGITPGTSRADFITAERDTRESLLARIEAEVRAKVAAEIRAKCPSNCAASTDPSVARGCEYEVAARIAEGNGDKTP